MSSVDEKIKLANEIIDYLKQNPVVKECKLHGSLANGNYDEYSDIDIQVDVSGFDNGKFMLMLPDIIRAKFPVVYTAFAPGLFPKVFVVSFSFSKDDIFSFIDLECTSTPHIQTITIDEIREKNDKISLMLKLTIANTKHFLRGQNCHEDIKRIAKFVLSSEEIEGKSDRDLLVHTLEWFKQNCDDTFKYIAIKCINYLS